MAASRAGGAFGQDERLLVDLINTRYLGDGGDVLAGPRAAQWLGERMPSPRRAPSIQALAPLRRLREGLRELASGNNGKRLDPALVAQADAVLEGVPMIVSVEHGAQIRPVAREGSAAHLIGVVAVALLSSHARGAWPRVKACAEPACRWAFFDRSRNGSRRWCDMSQCGNRAKNHAWRSRQSEA